MKVLVLSYAVSALTVGLAHSQSAADPMAVNSEATRFAVHAADGSPIAAVFIRVPAKDDGSLLGLEWTYIPRAAGQATVETWATLPFHQVGSIQRVADDTVLVSGFDASSNLGVLARVTRSIDPAHGPQVQIVETVTWSDLRPYRVVWNPTDGLLYVGDADTHGFQFAGWGGPGNPLPPSLIPVPWAEGSGPYSEASYWQRIWVKSGEPGFRLQHTDVLPQAWARYDLAVGAFVVDYGPARLSQDLPTWNVSDASTVSSGAVGKYPDGSTVQGPSSIGIAGPAGAGSILDRDATAIAQFTLARDWEHEAVPVPSMFNSRPGALYTIHSSDPGVADLDIRPTVRLGAANQAGDFWFWSNDADPRNATVGNADYAVFAVLRSTRSGGPDQPTIASPSVLFAFRNADGTDPIVDVAGRTVLDFVAAVQRPVPIDPPGLFFRARHPIPIPDDPALDGTVLLVQWMLANSDGSVSLSDITGTAVRVPPTGDGRASGASGSGTPPARRASAEASLLEAFAGSAEDAAEARRVLQRLGSR